MPITRERIESEERVTHPTSGKKLDYPVKTVLVKKDSETGKIVKEYESIHAISPFAFEEKLKEFKKKIGKDFKDLSREHSKKLKESSKKFRELDAKIDHLVVVINEKQEIEPYVRIVLRTYIANLKKLLDKKLDEEFWTETFEKMNYFHEEARKKVKEMAGEFMKPPEERMKDLVEKLMRKYPKER